MLHILYHSNDSVAHYSVIEPGEIGLKINKENVLINTLPLTHVEVFWVVRVIE